MEFSEDKAREIINKYNLSHTTLKVWKSRNKIPDKYQDDNYIKNSIIVDKADKIMQERIKSILKMPEINRATLIKLSQCDTNRINAVANEKSTLTKAEIFSLQKEIKRLRIDIINAFKTDSLILLKQILKNPLLKRYVIIHDEYLAKRSFYAAVEFTKEEYFFIKDSYIKVATQLNIS